MQQKKFMDIERAKFGDSMVPPNVGAFEAGDEIVIQEKVDGSNASFRYDAETGKLAAFSRKHELSFTQTLNGFWNFVQGLDAEQYRDMPNYVIFGEWLTPHTIKYNKENYNKWYMYDIYDIAKPGYLPQEEVEKFAKEHGLTYVHTLYAGPFVSWEHCMGFCHSPAYGENQEGIVIKNMAKLNSPDERNPFVIKIVNDCFSEIKKSNHVRKIEDPQKIKEKEAAQAVAEEIVTENRVRKEILKMQDEGVLPAEIAAKDMKTVAQNLPKRIYEDCLKEEPEMVEAAGEYFGKMCAGMAMQHARAIILGG